MPECIQFGLLRRSGVGALPGLVRFGGHMWALGPSGRLFVGSLLSVCGQGLVKTACGRSSHRPSHSEASAGHGGFARVSASGCRWEVLQASRTDA